MTKHGLSVKDKFELYLSPEPNSGCWLWTGHLGWGGYGHFNWAKNKPIKAHRASWLLFIGEIPQSMHVLHKCDNRACCNPDHLFLGTNNDNVADKVAKNRQSKGERSSLSKLNSALVLEIRSSSETDRGIGKRLGVGKSVVNLIRNRKAWRHVP
jgi:hypothetical protein